MRTTFLIFLFLTFSIITAADRPNVLLIMVDDLGYSDFGCYGSEIETPQIDKLGTNGLRFTQFYNTGKCHSSRVSLLTGLYCGEAGDSSLKHGTTIAQVMKSAGYFTSMSGKWHLNGEPTDFGFDRYWGHLSGATDFFAGNSTFRLNGKKWDDFGEDFYTTDAKADFSLKFLDEALKSGKPFFHYIAYNAPHYPLQAPKEDIMKYMNHYKGGFQEIRQARIKKQIQLGLFKNGTKLPAMPHHVSDWDKMTPEKREFENFRMAIYAAMVDKVDRSIGRVVDFLKENGQFENTLIMLVSDNGACPLDKGKSLKGIPPWEAKSNYFYNANWATVGNTPLKHYKQTQHEGGISTPFIVSWPKGITQNGKWIRQPSHLIDVMATCIEVAKAKYPVAKQVKPLRGKSLAPHFIGAKAELHKELYFLFGNCRALRVGDWKLVSFYGAQWELYNIAEDRFEQNDLSAQYPEKVKDMAARWTYLAENVDGRSKKQLSPAKGDPLTKEPAPWHNEKKNANWVMPK